MKIAILGCSGAMGSYFARRFIAEGHDVVGSDVRRTKPVPRGLRLAGSNREAVEGADAVLLAVPIRVTSKVARDVAPRLKRGAVVVEIASVKAKVRGEAARALRARNVSLLSVHPLFGPLSRSPRPKICVVGGAPDISVARSIFPGAELIPLNERDHDRLMAYALSLVHILNLAFASLVSKAVGVDEFDIMSTPLGSAQLDQAEAVLSQDPSLISNIQLENPFVPEVISSLVEELDGLKKIIAAKDVREFERRFALLSGGFSRAELDDALKRVYSASGRPFKVARLRDRT